MARLPKMAAGSVFAVMLVVAAAAAAQTVTYLDDFSTNRADLDAYEHSPILAAAPLPGSPAALVYAGVDAARRLEFHGGTPDPRAILNYHLPLSGSGIVLGGTVEFDASVVAGVIFPSLFIGITDDPNGSHGVYVVSSAQHCSFPVPAAGNGTYVLFQGKGMAIDNLQVTLNCEGPVDAVPTAWGSIKGLYR